MDEGKTVAPAQERTGEEALVKKWIERVRSAKKHFEPDFKRMRRNMKLAKLGSADEEMLDNPQAYIANITQRAVKMMVAQLYAKNPRVLAQLRPRIDYAQWDGTRASLDQAMQDFAGAAQLAVGIGADPLELLQIQSPQSAAILAEIDQVKQAQAMLAKIGKTMKILLEYFMDEGRPRFKSRLKRAVRRALVCGVAPVRLGYQRLMETDPVVSQKLDDATARINHLERLLEEAQDRDGDASDADLEELRLMVETLQGEKDIVVREGLIFDFMRPTSLIPDPEVTDLASFDNARWIAIEFVLTPDKIQEHYGVELEGKFTAYQNDGRTRHDTTTADAEEGSKPQFACVYEVQDKESGLVYVVCEGYDRFLKPPAPPDIYVEGFFDVWCLVFHPVEDEERVYPHSAVELIEPMQNEYNRSRTGLKEHRRANRPQWVSPKGALEEEDKAKLESNTPFALLEINALSPGQDVKTLIQPKPVAPIDPNLYDVNQAFADIQRVLGLNEARLGELSGATATEASIGAQATATSDSADVDELDEFLMDLARGAGQILLDQMGVETVQRIAGPGAVWPERSRQEIAEQVFLSVKAGSSGRPNRAQDLANFERGAPWIIQTPGVNPEWFATKALEVLFEDIDIEEAIASGAPAITALNAMAGRMAANPGAQPTGRADTDPNQQGGQGAVNAPASDTRPGGPQPAYPSAVPA